jgi:hypothetical protein
MSIVPVVGSTTWRQFINQIKAYLSESSIKTGHFGDTVVVNCIYNGMVMSLLWCPFELLEEINFDTNVRINVSGNTGTLNNSLIRLKLVLANSPNLSQAYAVPKELEDWYATCYRFPGDTEPIYAKKGFTIKIFPDDVTSVDVTYVKKPAKWQSVSDDNAYIQIPLALEPAVIAMALYYLRQRDTNSPTSGVEHWNNFKDIIGSLYQIFGLTPPRIGLTPSEQSQPK